MQGSWDSPSRPSLRDEPYNAAISVLLLKHRRAAGLQPEAGCCRWGTPQSPLLLAALLWAWHFPVERRRDRRLQSEIHHEARCRGRGRANRFPLALCWAGFTLLCSSPSAFIRDSVPIAQVASVGSWRILKLSSSNKVNFNPPSPCQMLEILQGVILLPLLRTGAWEECWTLFFSLKIFAWGYPAL